MAACHLSKSGSSLNIPAKETQGFSPAGTFRGTSFRTSLNAGSNQLAQLSECLLLRRPLGFEGEWLPSAGAIAFAWDRFYENSDFTLAGCSRRQRRWRNLRVVGLGSGGGAIPHRGK